MKVVKDGMEKGYCDESEMAKVEIKNVSKYIVNKKENSAVAVLYNANAVFEDAKFNVILVCATL